MLRALATVLALWADTVIVVHARILVQRWRKSGILDLNSVNDAAELLVKGSQFGPKMVHSIYSTGPQDTRVGCSSSSHVLSFIEVPLYRPTLTRRR